MPGDDKRAGGALLSSSGLLARLDCPEMDERNNLRGHQEENMVSEATEGNYDQELMNGWM